MKVAMKNTKTGAIKEVKVGWSWTLFLFSGIFGLPLFLRRLHVWGALFLALCVVDVIVGLIPASAQFGAFDFIPLILFGLIPLILFGLSIFVAIKGNEMTAKNYLENGWTFVEPDSEITKMAKMQWGITI
jgi:hypothetical protein